MAERRMGIIAVLLCLCLCLMPCPARAASTAEPIDTEQRCTLTISYRRDGTAVSGLQVKLYQIAEVSPDFQYTLTALFSSAGLALNGITSVGEWNVIRSTLESRILADGIAPSCTAATDLMGQICFDELTPGLYLAVSGPAPRGIRFDPALIALPGLGADGGWQYHLSVAPKGEITPPSGPNPAPDPTPTPDPSPDPDPSSPLTPGHGTMIQLKVLKLWKDDSGWDRPQSVDVEIFRDGVSNQIMTLSEDNHWSYSWATEDDGADWMVVERNVPKGYTVAVEERAGAFILTNTWQPEEIPPEDPPADDPEGSDSPTPGTPSPGTQPGKEPLPPDSPKTGDTPRIMLYTLLMYVSGSILILLGITGKRKDI